jgi:1,4-alpha-glucan branching enzyme
MNRVIPGVSLFTDVDIYLFKEGRHFRLYDKLGAHPMEVEGRRGTLFAVWAPNAERVSVIGDFNDWNQDAHILYPRLDESGVWEGFVPGAYQGQFYKYHIRSKYRMYRTDRADPFARYTEMPPNTASVIWNLEYGWHDAQWLGERGLRNALHAPQSLYEVHLGSWRRVPEESNRSLTYRELAARLPGYVSEMGFTHVELLPVMEHPFYGSWGYQTLGYFAPTARFGRPQDFMFLVDRLHQQGIGVILDWVPSHFPGDGHGLAYFDGTHLYEHEDPRQGYHPDWNSYIFNYGRNEVRSFLISSALFWLDKYHVDGLRVDAVASMLYLDYSRRDGEWALNRYGGRENLEAIDFLRTLNEAVYANFPDVQTTAEESTAWPMVSRPTSVGGLGFGMKWNMGWMHDTLSYLAKDPVHRKHHHNQLTFSIWYAFYENFILPMSHDEVVYGKGSLLDKMPGDFWQKCANLRLLFGYMFGHPGKKLLFMGSELGQWAEWSHDQSLQWHLAEQPAHHGIRRLVQDLNQLYRAEPALYELDFEQAGFSWVDCTDADQSVLSFLRKGANTKDLILVAANFTPVPRTSYRVGVPQGGFWREILNSDAVEYGGSGQGNLGGVEAAPMPCHGYYFSVVLTLPPLGVVFLKKEATESEKERGQNEMFVDIPEMPMMDFFLKRFD